MMEWTDRHCRFFHRLLSRRARLYTEMITTGAVLHGDRAVGRLARLNTRDGRLRGLSDDAPRYGHAWLLDAKGTLRVVGVSRDGRFRLHWLEPGTERWRVVIDQPLLTGDSWAPRFLQDEHTLVVEGRAGGRDIGRGGRAFRRS